MRNAPLLLILLLAIVLLGGTTFWWLGRNARIWGLSAGAYELSFVATRGSRQGKTVRGNLVLASTAKTDRSPRTGEIAKDPDIRYFPLYGWLDANLLEVGAPLCPGGLAPPPSSRDPVFPGVIVQAIDPAWNFGDRVKRPPGAPILAIGTLANMRNGRLGLDGCGIGLFVQAAGSGCWRGEWSEFGLQHDGAGTFSLCRAD
jgi:hypothetical protein